MKRLPLRLRPVASSSVRTHWLFSRASRAARSETPLLRLGARAGHLGSLTRVHEAGVRARRLAFAHDPGASAAPVRAGGRACTRAPARTGGGLKPRSAPVSRALGLAGTYLWRGGAGGPALHGARLAGVRVCSGGNDLRRRRVMGGSSSGRYSFYSTHCPTPPRRYHRGRPRPTPAPPSRARGRAGRVRVTPGRARGPQRDACAEGAGERAEARARRTRRITARRVRVEPESGVDIDVWALRRARPRHTNGRS